jgi:tetratricopeptide (TPR) repeat protein
MSQPTWEKVKALFHEAAALPADERVALFDRACAGDERLRAEVEALLASHEELKALEPETVTQGGGAPTEGAGSVVGRYKLLQPIGEGGFGTVYMAEQQQPVRRRVALKIIKLGMDTKHVIARFEAERQALALMDHPNIAKVLDAGATETGRPYFVMELVRGVSITEYCDQNRLSTPKRLELFMTVCGAVQHAHQKGVIHRDIKPNNVMITLHDGTPVPKIIDFGIAKATNQRLTERTLFTEYNQFIGTPAYMSPEQAEMSGLDVDTRSDIYSLGVLLYELLTGTTPLDSQRLKQVAYSEIQRMIREEEPHRPSVLISTLGQAATTAAEQRRTDLPGLARMLRGDLDWVVMKALEKDRTRRYETANAMRQDLERYLGNEPVSASPPGTIYRMRKFMRRNRAVVGVGAAVAAALFVGLLLAATGFVEARREAEASIAINDFFNEMLAAVDPRHLRQYSGFGARRASLQPEGERAHDVSVVDMILGARANIGSSFAGKPSLEATARETIGLSLLGLGRPRDGTAELEKAAAIRRAALGEEHPDTLRTQLQLALGLTESGRDPEAVSLLRELREKMTRVYGESDPRTLQASSLLATALMQDHEHAAADPIFEKTLELQREVLGPEHRDTLATMIQWSCSRLWRGQHAKSEELARPAHEAALRTLGPDDPLTLWALTELGWMLRFKGDEEGAEASLRAAVEGLSRKLGDGHPHTSIAKMGLGGAISGSGDGEEQVRMWTEALEGLRVSQGKASPIIYVISRDLAFLLLRRGRTDEGLHLLRRGVDDFREKYGPDHFWTRQNLRHLRDGLRRAGREAEAVEVSRQLLDRERVAAEATDADASALNNYAWALLTWDIPQLRDPAAALPLAERALERWGEESRETVLDTLALALHENGRNDEALERQREALALIPREEAENRTDLVARLGLYLATAGSEAEAREAVVAHVRKLHETSQTNADFVRTIGGFSNRMAEHRLHAHSELARREALEITRTRRGDDPVATAGLLYRLGRALLHQGKADEAESILREGLSLARRTDDEQLLTYVQINLAEALIHNGRYREALDLAAETVDRRKEDRDPQGGYFNKELTMEAKRQLGTARLRLGDARGAEAPLREAEQWFTRNRGPAAWRRARAESAWGEYVLVARGADDAENLLFDAHLRLEESLGADATATRDAARRVERLREARR